MIDSPIHNALYQVQDAIHAPRKVWEDCLGPVYVNGDHSLPSMLSIFPNVIEKSARTVVVHGLAVRALACLLRGMLACLLCGMTVC